MMKLMKVGLGLTVGLVSLGVMNVNGSEEAVDSNTRFALELYHQLASEKEGENMFFSPYSVSNALAMTAEGAREGTAMEMGKVLGLPKSALAKDDKSRPWNLKVLHEGISALNSKFNRDHKPYQLSVANAIWGERSFPFNDKYVEAINGSYGTNSLRDANFVGASEAERLRINTWVEDKTENRIKDLLPEGSVNGLTRLVLTNAIYFKGDWKTQFIESATTEGDFHLSNGEKSKAKLMNKTNMGGVGYAAFNADGSQFKTPAVIARGEKVATYPGDDGFSMVELPYKGDELSMVVIAPRSPDGLQKIEEQMNAESLTTWIGQLRERKVHVTLPKFKSETEYTLNSGLAKMGMPSAFQAAANFNGLQAGESENDLYISLVVHKAFVEVNEEGTEAAAATGVVLLTRSARIDTSFVPVFRADRPFIYLIRDKESGSILFLGRMNNPS